MYFSDRTLVRQFTNQKFLLAFLLLLAIVSAAIHPACERVVKADEVCQAALAKVRASNLQELKEPQWGHWTDVEISRIIAPPLSSACGPSLALFNDLPKDVQDQCYCAESYELSPEADVDAVMPLSDDSVEELSIL